MRLEAQAKMGFYPAPPEVVSLICQRLKSPKDEKDFSILDPCCGEGVAIDQIAEELEAYADSVYAVELDQARVAKAKEQMPDAYVIGPASFFGIGCPSGSMSFVWCNPPFDDEIGGGARTEQQFLGRATQLLRTGGILALVVPEKIVNRYGSMRNTLKTWYDEITIVPFPEEHRKFREVVVLAIKRKDIVSPYSREDSDVFLCPPKMEYQIPSGKGPGGRFKKINLTDEEYEQAMESSELMNHLRVPQEPPLSSPPLALGVGHVSLLLAAGQLDGVVRPPGEPPHVVRGTAFKTEFVKSSENTEDSKGNTNNKTTISERITLTIRAVDESGEIRTFTDNGNGNPSLESQLKDVPKEIKDVAVKASKSKKGRVKRRFS